MAMSWFTRKAANGAAGAGAPPVPAAPPPPNPSLWGRMGVVRLFRRTRRTPDGVEVSTTVVTAEAPPAGAAPPAAAAAAPLLVLAPVARSAWQKFRDRLSAGLETLDLAISGVAAPFGVHIREPRRRYAVLLSVFACLFVVGALPIPYLPLIALAIGYVGALAISRAWVVNERERTAIVKKLRDGNPDELPDLRGAALASALLLLILFPLVFMQAHRHFGLYKVDSSANFLDWAWFAFDKTYLKALPDWSILYGIHISKIEASEPWGRHLVLLSRLTFDYILLQGIFRLLAIRATIREAVAVVKTDPDVAVRVGTRAIPALIDKLSDPDRAVRGAAANALTQLGDPEGLRQMSEAIADTAGRNA